MIYGCTKQHVTCFTLKTTSADLTQKNMSSCGSCCAAFKLKVVTFIAESKTVLKKGASEQESHSRKKGSASGAGKGACKVCL